MIIHQLYIYIYGNTCYSQGKLGNICTSWDSGYGIKVVASTNMYHEHIRKRLIRREKKGQHLQHGLSTTIIFCKFKWWNQILLYTWFIFYILCLPINPFPYTDQIQTYWKMRGKKNTLITFTPLHNQIYSKKANWRSMNTDNKLYTLRTHKHR